VSMRLREGVANSECVARVGPKLVIRNGRSAAARNILTSFPECWPPTVRSRVSGRGAA